MTTRDLNKQKKKRKCLGCGREIWTDRCHRFCETCSRKNSRNGSSIDECRVSISPELDFIFGSEIELE